MPTIPQQILIKKSNKEVVAFGFTDLTSFGGKDPIETYPAYDADTYDIVKEGENNVVLPITAPDCAGAHFWNSTTEEYQDTSPV